MFLSSDCLTCKEIHAMSLSINSSTAYTLSTLKVDRPFSPVPFTAASHDIGILKVMVWAAYLQATRTSKEYPPSVPSIYNTHVLNTSGTSLHWNSVRTTQMPSIVSKVLETEIHTHWANTTCAQAPLTSCMSCTESVAAPWSCMWPLV